MNSILDDIVRAKRAELRERYPASARAELQRAASVAPPVRSLRTAVEAGSGIIAEFKRRSPSHGEFSAAGDLRSVVRGYESAGASALSILSDGPSFGGALEDLAVARAATRLPVLQKDFIVSEEQIVEARASGGDAILLIAAVLTPSEVQSLARVARDLTLEVLLELHHADELDRVCSGIEMIGVNNRDLHTLNIDVTRSFELASLLPTDVTRVAESGLRSPEVVRDLRAAGFSGFLIGETFLRETDPSAACEAFIREARG